MNFVELKLKTKQQRVSFWIIKLAEKSINNNFIYNVHKKCPSSNILKIMELKNKSIITENRISDFV